MSFPSSQNFVSIAGFSTFVAGWSTFVTAAISDTVSLQKSKQNCLKYAPNMHMAPKKWIRTGCLEAVDSDLQNSLWASLLYVQTKTSITFNFHSIL